MLPQGHHSGQGTSSVPVFTDLIDHGLTSRCVRLDVGMGILRMTLMPRLDVKLYDNE